MSRSPACTSATAPSMPCAASTSTFATASSPCWSARPAAARARCCGPSPGWRRSREGTIEIGGEVVNDFRPRDRDVAMVFQDYALYPHMSVAKNIGFGLKARKMPKAGDRGARRRGGANARHHPAARPLSAPAFRRPAPARRHRPRHRAQSAHLPVRRAALQSRCAASRRDARRDQAPAPGASPRR